MGIGPGMEGSFPASYILLEQLAAILIAFSLAPQSNAHMCSVGSLCKLSSLHKLVIFLHYMPGDAALPHKRHLLTNSAQAHPVLKAPRVHFTFCCPSLTYLHQHQGPQTGCLSTLRHSWSPKKKWKPSISKTPYPLPGNLSFLT